MCRKNSLPCLAAGYYNAPEKTAEAFVQDQRNHMYPERLYKTGDIGVLNERGELIFCGRKDTLIKHRGYRIELGEIENVAIATGIVRNVCALYDFKSKRIVLFYESLETNGATELRKAIASVLPHYMVPNIFVHETNIPRNANGKLDRQALSSLIPEITRSMT